MLEPEQEQSPPPGVPASNARAQGGPAGEDAAAGGGPTQPCARGQTKATPTFWSLEEGAGDG